MYQSNKMTDQLESAFSSNRKHMNHYHAKLKNRHWQLGLLYSAAGQAPAAGASGNIAGALTGRHYNGKMNAVTTVPCGYFEK